MPRNVPLRWLRICSMTSTRMPSLCIPDATLLRTSCRVPGCENLVRSSRSRLTRLWPDRSAPIAGEDKVAADKAWLRSNDAPSLLRQRYCVWHAVLDALARQIPKQPGGVDLAPAHAENLAAPAARCQQQSHSSAGGAHLGACAPQGGNLAIVEHSIARWVGSRTLHTAAGRGINDIAGNEPGEELTEDGERLARHLRAVPQRDIVNECDHVTAANVVHTAPAPGGQ